MTLARLYFIRGGFSLLWVTLVALFGKSELASFLFVVYPAWDAAATFWDSRINSGTGSSKTPQYVNVAISIATTIGVVLALRAGVPAALMVFGFWAILTGLIQLVLGLKRRRMLKGQWPMIISGGQSMLGGTSFILLAHKPDMGITSLAGYAAFGAFYFLWSAIRLSKKAGR